MGPLVPNIERCALGPPRDAFWGHHAGSTLSMPRCAFIRAARKCCSAHGRILEFLASRPRLGPPAARQKLLPRGGGGTTPVSIRPDPCPPAATVYLAPAKSNRARWPMGLPRLLGS
jgi:hypothetical protein